MKNNIVLFLSLLIVNISYAQDLVHNYEEALSQATEESKSVMMIFTGSDWCKPCMQFKKNILQDQNFINYADRNLVLLEVDFPYRKKNRLSKEQRKHNDELAAQYNPKAVFPLMIMLDEKGTITKKMGYDNRLSPQAYTKYIDQLIANK